MRKRKFSGLHFDLSREKGEGTDCQTAGFPESLVMDRMSGYGWNSGEELWDVDFGPTPGTT